jgi:hypothetical protein
LNVPRNRPVIAILACATIVVACAPNLGSQWHRGAESRFEGSIGACAPAAADKARADFRRFPIAEGLTLSNCAATVDPATRRTMLAFALDEMSDREIVYIFNDRDGMLDRYWWAPTGGAQSKF